MHAQAAIAIMTCVPLATDETITTLLLHSVGSYLAVEVKTGGLPVVVPFVIGAAGCLTRCNAN